MCCILTLHQLQRNKGIKQTQCLLLVGRITTASTFTFILEAFHGTIVEITNAKWFFLFLNFFVCNRFGVGGGCRPRSDLLSNTNSILVHSHTVLTNTVIKKRCNGYMRLIRLSFYINVIYLELGKDLVYMVDASLICRCHVWLIGQAPWACGHWDAKCCREERGDADAESRKGERFFETRQTKNIHGLANGKGLEHT